MSQINDKPPSQGGSIPEWAEALGPVIHDRGWVSLREFLKIADIGYPTALRWCRLKMINYVQVGGTKRVYAEEIARFLRHGTLPPDPVEWQKEKAQRVEYLRTKPQLKNQG